MRHVPEKKEEKGVPTKVERAEDRPVVVPSVDILQGEDATVLVADMPGVDEATLDIRVEQGVLTISGNVEPETFEGCEATLTGYRPGSYERAFTLSDELDVDNIKASIKDGILTLTLPKTLKAKPKRIHVRAGG